MIHVRLLLFLFPGVGGERRRVVGIVIGGGGVSISVGFGWVCCRGGEGDEEIVMAPFHGWVFRHGSRFAFRMVRLEYHNVLGDDDNNL